MLQCANSKIAYVIPGTMAFTNESIVEPVSVAEVKHYLHIGFSDDDTLISALITTAREWAEEKAGLSLITRTITCTINCPYGQSIELPHGPVISITTTVPVGQLYNGPFPRIKNVGGQIEVTYQAGYSALPTGLKTAILAKTASLYENRGDQNNPNDGVAKSILSTYKRVRGWL